MIDPLISSWNNPIILQRICYSNQGIQFEISIKSHEYSITSRSSESPADSTTVRYQYKTAMNIVTPFSVLCTIAGLSSILIACLVYGIPHNLVCVLESKHSASKFQFVSNIQLFRLNNNNTHHQRLNRRLELMDIFLFHSTLSLECNEINLVNRFVCITIDIYVQRDGKIFIQSTIYHLSTVFIVNIHRMVMEETTRWR